MNYRELEFFNSHGILFENVIARGANGLIYLVHSNQQQPKKYVIKRYPNYLFKDKDLENLVAINSENLVKIYNYYKYNDQVYLQMEYCPSNLEKLILESNGITPSKLKNYIMDVVSCVKTCHDNEIAILDFTLSNFLIDEQGKIKLNFLSLKHIVQDPDNLTGVCMKSMNYFLPPEVLDLTEYDEMSSDIWSLGCILYFMATRTLPFESKDMKLLKERIKACDYSIDLVEDTNLRDIIQKCLRADPYTRSTVNNILKMRYFGSIGASKSSKRLVLKSEWRKSVCFIRRNMTFIQTNVKRHLPVVPNPRSASETMF